MEREVVMRASTGYGKQLPSGPVGWLLVQLPEVARRAVRMRFEGRSTVRGVRPDWLERASDIRVVDVYGADDAHVVFQCPTLGEGAPEFYDQRELWASRPDPDLTAFELVGDTIQSLAAGDRDSDLIDRALLQAVLRLANAVDSGFTDICLPGRTAAREGVAINRAVVETAGEFLRSTPRPERVRVSGTLDMVRASTSAFGLVLDGGEEISGILLDGNVREIGRLLTKPVIVQGTAVFRPSGNVLRLEADSVSGMPEVSRFWSEMPKPREEHIRRSDLVQRQGPRSGIAAIMGAWPGDETDAEIAEFLKEIS